MSFPSKFATSTATSATPFLWEEISRLKAKNPKISHKEAFSTAAKNWAHFPEIHFELSIKGNNHV
ncbi:hypothetical protein Cni_G19651 [Canna indica]|uniref:YABBY protein C-terminal domain-containing protein n=1 Tax=Canna indica TaxID=4628 RepID=A0AAQ3KS29_9LILI|nr:hypothetical protein Cni_G19651 [Canna indica]